MIAVQQINQNNSKNVHIHTVQITSLIQMILVHVLIIKQLN